MFNPFNAIASIGSSLIQAKQSRKNIDSQARHNRELADRQYGHQLDMWNKMNQYNAPTAQMQRYKDAGLNPHLIYGKGGSAGNASTMPQYQEQTTDFSQRRAFDPGAVLQQYHSLNLAKEKAIMANADNAVRSSAEGIKYRKEQLRDNMYKGKAEREIAQYNRDIRALDADERFAQSQYFFENAKLDHALKNKNVTAREIDNDYKQIQLNAARYGRDIETDGLIKGFTKILQGEFDHPYAKNVWYNTGQYAARIAEKYAGYAGAAKLLKTGKQQPNKGTTITTTYDAKGKRTGSKRTRHINNQHRD